ncbi:hypothetical protein ACNKHP_05675 [Shigella boydii]
MGGLCFTLGFILLAVCGHQPVHLVGNDGNGWKKWGVISWRTWLINTLVACGNLAGLLSSFSLFNLVLPGW